jgi:hypothetical protein
MSDEDTPLERIRRHFGVYEEAPRFDLSVKTLLNLPLPEGAVREIVGNIWSEAYEEGRLSER